MQDKPEAQNPCSQPWWRYGYVWLVISGPAVVVVASFVTFGIAAGTSDPLVAQDDYRQGIEINKTLADEQAKALLPALQGRNHAASPAPRR
ncbi:MAG TPA: FixH family protein [Ramlibacter sp.]|nr:FixH family protein [Ramlibacter sp.]